MWDPGNSVDVFKANQFHDETQVENKNYYRIKHIYVSETPTQQQKIA